MPPVMITIGKFDGGRKLLNYPKYIKNSNPDTIEILSFATSHYATSMQLIVICNYLGDVCNYKFGIV